MLAFDFYDSSWGQALVERSLRLASIQTPLQHVPVPRTSIWQSLAFLFPRQQGTGTRRFDFLRICHRNLSASGIGILLLRFVEVPC